MTDPRIIPPGEVLPPMDLGERPARRNGRHSTNAKPKPKGKPSRGGGTVRRRFALLNAFIDVALPRLGPVDVAVWLVLYRHGQRDGTAPTAVSDLARRTGHRNAAVRLALRRIVAECGFPRLRDLTRESVECWAATVQRAGMSARTVNAHLAALIAFANWAVAVGRLLGNPLARLPKLDE